MQLYFVSYVIGDGQTIFSGPFADQESAAAAYNWFLSLAGCTQVQLLSIAATLVHAWTR